MALFKYGFCKKDFLFGGIITVIITAVALILFIIGLSTRVFDPIGQALEGFHLSDGLFYSQAKRQLSNIEINPDIVIVDIQDSDSREEISQIIRKINQAGPKSLAVDIIFGRYASASSREDSALVASLKESPNLIIAQRNVRGENGWHNERSFFADEVVCQEGDVSFNPGTVRSFSPSFDVDGETAPSFIALIAQQAGLEVPSGELTINYAPVKTVSLSPSKINDYSLLHDQIVILGDAGDLRDYHQTPILFNGQPRAPGVYIIAQCVYTLQPHNKFYSCPEWLSIIIGFTLTYLFCTFIASPMYRNNKFNGLWIAIWQVVVLVILLVITYILFWEFHFIVSLTYWLLGVGLSEFSTELFYFFEPKIIKE